MPTFDLEYRHKGPVAGIDEVGRGPLAGPVVAAAVVFHTYDVPQDVLSLIQDSKVLSSAQRLRAMQALTPYSSVAWGAASRNTIDGINILRASLLAMQRAMTSLARRHGDFDHILVDGNHCPSFSYPASAVVKGDGLSFSIAAASIYAKELRDRLMVRLAARYPEFCWENNAGYGTAAHLNGLKTVGLTPHHRLSFRPVALQQRA
jgi:ribonuclease HII